MDVVCISVMAGMLSAVTGFLILSTVSSKPMSSYIFCSTRKNRYARIFNGVVSETNTTNIWSFDDAQLAV